MEIFLTILGIFLVLGILEFIVKSKTNYNNQIALLISLNYLSASYTAFAQEYEERVEEEWEQVIDIVRISNFYEKKSFYNFSFKNEKHRNNVYFQAVQSLKSIKNYNNGVGSEVFDSCIEFIKTHREYLNLAGTLEVCCIHVSVLCQKLSSNLK